MQLEAKAKAPGALVEVGSVFPPRSRASVPQRVVGRIRLTIYRIELEFCACAETAGPDQQHSDHRAQVVPVGDALFVSAQLRKSPAGIGFHLAVGLAQRRAAEISLHQSDGDSLRISEIGGAIVGCAPLGELGIKV